MALLADGGVAGLLDRDESRLELVVGRVDQPLALRAAPARARAIRMHDTLRGLAIDRDATRVLRTQDGARSWQPLPPVVAGSLTPAVLGVDERESWQPADLGVLDALECAGTWCRIGRVAISGWGPPRVAQPALARSSRASVAIARPNGVALACVVSGTERMPRLPRGDAPPGSRQFVRFAHSGSARMDVWSQPDGQRIWQVAWAGWDERGSFGGLSRPTPSWCPSRMSHENRRPHQERR